MRSPHRHDDGAAEVIGVVLLVGLVAVASFGLLLISEPTQERAADGLRIQRAENGLLQLSANFRSLSNDASRSSEVDLGLGGLGEHSSLSVPDTGRIVVTGGDGETVLNASLGAVEYEMDGTTLAYQGGGVWRGVGDRSQLVSMPPLDYRQGTVTLDFVAVEGADRLGSSRLQLVERRSTRAVRSLHFSDRHRSVRISVVSRYYGGWADYFREEFERATVIVDHDERRVSVYLGRLGGGFTADNVLTAFGGDVVISTGHSRVEGTIARDGTVTVDQASQHVGSVTDTPDARPLDFWVERSVALAERQGVTTIGPSATVDEGRYLVDGDLTIDGGDRLTVDLSAGNVTILVDGNVTIRNGQLRVRNPVGDHRLRILTTGNLAMKNGQAYVEPMGSVDARHLQVYGTSDMQVGLVGGSTYFEGFLYAPREDPVVGENPAVLTQSVQCDLNGDEADVCISTGNTAVEGAIHAGPAVVKQSTTVEYDPGLSSVSFSVSPGTAGMAPLDHLNLAVRGVGIRQD